MSDIFSEVDDDVRREELAQLWTKYGKYLFGLACLVIGAVAAWVAWDRYQDTLGARSGAAFDAAARLIQDGKRDEGEAAFAKLVADGTPGYRQLAQLRLANEIASRDAPAAVTEYDRIAATSSQQPLFRQLAQVRAASLLVDTASYADVAGRLEPMAAPCQPHAAGWGSWLWSLVGVEPAGCPAFRHTARELLALSAWHNGDPAQARRWVDAARSDADAPGELRQRMELLAAILPADAGAQAAASPAAAPTGTP